MQIEDACRRKGWRDIMISSVEQFQGKEKKIIIVSTVRSKSDNIGFLNNFRVNFGNCFDMMLLTYLIIFFFFFSITASQCDNEQSSGITDYNW